MERRHIPETESKLVILYALNRLGPVTGMQLLQFMAELDLMNYFTMQLNLCEMIEQGQVAERAHPLGALLLVTGEGAYTLGAFDRRIPASRREAIDREAPVWHERFRAEQQTLADSFPLHGGGTCIRLRLLEADTALLDLILTLPGETSLPFLQRRWRGAAQDVYSAIVAFLSQGYRAEGPLPALPEGTSLQAVRPNEWLLSLSDSADRPALNLMLTLPEERLARFYAARWPLYLGGFRDAILKELREEIPEA